MRRNRIDFAKIFGVRKDDDDRRLDINNLSDDQLDMLAEQLDTGEEYDDSGNRVSRHELDKLADLVCESTGGQWDRPKALHYMMHTPRGAALVHRLKKAIKQRKEQPIMGKMETLEKFVKKNGFEGIAKHIYTGGEVNLTEAEFTKLATEAARRDYPNDRPDVAFSKYFQSNEVVQRAHQIVKGTATIMPVFVDADVDGVNDPEDALAQLEALVAQLRASAPWMSKAQAFSRVYQDPTNIELVKRERLQNRPRAG